MRARTCEMHRFAASPTPCMRHTYSSQVMRSRNDLTTRSGSRRANLLLAQSAEECFYPVP